MESKVEAVLAGKKSSFPEEEGDDKDALAMAASSSASPAAIFAFLAPPLSLLRHVACLCAGYLGLKPSSAPAPASSSSSAAAAAGQQDEVDQAAASEDCTEVVLEVRSRGRGFTPPQLRSITPRESATGAVGGKHH